MITQLFKTVLATWVDVNFVVHIARGKLIYILVMKNTNWAPDLVCRGGLRISMAKLSTGLLAGSTLNLR